MNGRGWLLALTGLALSACVESEEPGGDFRQLNFNEQVYNQQYSDVNAAHQGAKLYDHWFTSPPTEYHPMWQPSDNPAVSIEDSWRCTSCHGWDYVGGKTIQLDTEGRVIRIQNSSLSRANKTMPARDIYAMIKFGSDRFPQHSYQDHLSDAEIYRLTRFIQTLVLPSDFLNHDSVPYINSDTGRALGILSEGEVYYRQGSKQDCLSCHNSKGVAQIGGQDLILGRLAIQEPWQFLHRLQHGIPHSTLINFDHDMEDFLFSSELIEKNDIITHLLTYAQNKLSRSPEGEDTIRGALLYDNLFLIKNIVNDPPANPQWVSLYPNTTVLLQDSWRCSSCHSWTYTGRSSAVPNLLNNTMSIAQLKDVIANGVLDGAATVHNYQTDTAINLTEQDVIDLAYFINQKLIDPNNFVFDLSGTTSQGERGMDLYTQNLFFSQGNAEPGECTSCPKCITCHEASGTGQFTSGIDSLYSRISEDRFRTFHRIRFGNPGFSMVGTSAVGLKDQDAADVMIYITQCLLPLSNPNPRPAYCNPTPP